MTLASFKKTTCLFLVAGATVIPPVSSPFCAGSLDSARPLSSWEQECTPEWVVRGEPSPDIGQGPLQTSGDLAGCPSIMSFAVPQYLAASRYDSVLEVTQLFVGDYPNNRIVRYDVDAALSYTANPLPLSYGVVWLAVDLDRDGQIELVVQRGDPGFGGNGYLDILSAPDWRLRQRFVWPDMKVWMEPVAVNIDADPYLELYLTSSDLSGLARARIIKYDAIGDGFALIADIPAPDGTGGPAAVGDFDNDGRVEFISGNFTGYDLFEYTGSMLVHVGPVGQPYGGYFAAAVRPGPGGTLNALLGHSSIESGFRYQLLEPTANNIFEVAQVFQRFTGWHGQAPCFGLDSDCDGPDELVMDFFPNAETWRWSESLGTFELGCTWNENTSGTFIRYYAMDLDQDLVPELGTINHNNILQAFKSNCAACQTAPSNLIAWWPFDEQSGSISKDVWGGNDGSYVGSPSATLGKVAGGLACNGSGTYVRVPASTAFNLGTGDLSMDAWIKTTDNSSINPILSEYDQLTRSGWVFWIDQGNALGLLLADGDSTAWISPRVGTFADGVWHHVAVTVVRDDTSGVKFYLDGNRIGSGNPTSRSGSLTNTAEVRIGGGYSSTGAPVFFNGVLDEVRLFRKALSFHEVRSVVTADSLGNCKPSSVVCNCNAQGDIKPDGVPDVFDVVGLIDYAFSGAAQPPKDPACPHVDRGDVNCDGVDDVFDVVGLIDYVFSGGRPPCNPCACGPYPLNCP